MSHLPKLGIASAPSNIAFIKYWGKRNNHLNLPVADSVSVCVEPHRTQAAIEFTGATGDAVYWDGQLLADSKTGRFARILEHLRTLSPADQAVTIRIECGVPPRAGLASSSGAMAALAVAADGLFQTALPVDQLSCLARSGSGSAARSIPDGFVRWRRGIEDDGRDSFGISIAPAEHWSELALVFVVLDDSPKAVSSTDGMIRTARTASRFGAWADDCQRLAPLAQHAIEQRDFQSLAQLAAPNAMDMHALCLTAAPPILYLSKSTISVLNWVHSQAAKTPLFCTLDAGPNPILFTLEEHRDELAHRLSRAFPGARLLHGKPGPGARLMRLE
jgi:diphosphomevalonate decarboxylase